MKTYLILLLLLTGIQSTTTKITNNYKSSHDIPEFFDDDQNIYCLAIGAAIIVLSFISALVIYRVKSRSAAFEGSLFQNLEDG